MSERDRGRRERRGTDKMEGERRGKEIGKEANEGERGMGQKEREGGGRERVMADTAYIPM